MDQLSDTYFYVTNIRGDVEAIVDEDGNEVASYSYDPWGVPTITGTLSLPNPLLYQGAYGNIWDEEIELYWMNARHYDPSISRFITQDRSHGTLTNTMSQNLYIYCYNSPFDYNDPSGNRIWLPGVGTVPLKSELTTEQREMYDKAKEENPNLGIYTFMQMWNEAEDISDKMRKYKKGSNGEDYNKYDFEFAFWTCFWIDKAKIGLSSDDKLEFANEIKAICYIESGVGNNKNAIRDGIMQTNAFDLLDSEKWFTGLDTDILRNMDVNKGGFDIDHGLIAGIAHFLFTAGGKGGAGNSLSEVQAWENSGDWIKNNLASISAGYGGGNAFVGNWFVAMGYDPTVDEYNSPVHIEYRNGGKVYIPNHLYGKDPDTGERYIKRRWETIASPYGEQVHRLATTGKMQRTPNDDTIVP